ncbi:SRPBCC family protein [Marinoscillum sp.]|uniref:SRPBCC family protein n=1 Tax=Marinoscillum sp. TaxID=2024838 RepID=UPI003BADAF01
MNSYGELINQNTLQFKRKLPGTVDRVWEYLVDPELRQKWFAGGPVNLKSGGIMELHFDHAKFSDQHDPIPDKYQNMESGSKSEATVLRVEKPNLLVINWEEGIVTFKLEQVAANEVLLTLTHERLQDSMDYRIGVLAGWHTHLDILVDVISGLSVRPFWNQHMSLEDEYEQKLNAGTLFSK